MEVEFTLSVGDIEAFVARREKRQQLSPAAPWIFGAAGALLCVLAIPAVLQGQVPWFLVVIAGVVALVRVLGWATRWYNRRQIERGLRDTFARGPHRLILAADGLYLVTPDSQTFLRWSGVRKIEQTDEQAFFITGERQGQIVPRRAFDSESAFDDFVDLACRYHDRPLLAFPEPEEGRPPGPSDFLTTRPNPLPRSPE